MPSPVASVRSRTAVRIAALGTAAVLGGLAASLQAEPASLEYAARVGAAYSDNLGRTAANKVASGSAVAGVQISAKRPTGRLSYDVTGDLSYYDYFEKAFKSELLGQMSGSAAYSIFPETFLWNAAGSFGQVRQDLSRPAAPGNREDVITFSTGPTLRAHFGTALEASLDARWSRAEYSKRGFDNDTIGARLVLGHRPSANTLLGAGVSFDDVTYSSRAGTATTNFNRREVFLRFDTRLARTQLSADAGYSKITGGNRDASSPLFRVRATRRLTPSFSVYVVYEQQYPTTQNDALVQPGLGATGTDQSILSAAPRLAKNTGAGIVFARPRTSFEVAFNRLSESGELGALGKRTYDQTTARFTRALSPRSNLSAFAAYSSEDVTAFAARANERGVGAAFNFNFGTSLGLDLQVEQRERSSAAVANRYSELSGGIYLRYGRVRQQYTVPAALPAGR